MRVDATERKETDRFDDAMFYLFWKFELTPVPVTWTKRSPHHDEGSVDGRLLHPFLGAYFHKVSLSYSHDDNIPTLLQ